MVVLAEHPCERGGGRMRGELVGLAGPALLARETDERLAALVREGDENAFAALVERYRRPLERHCRRTLPPARAEDALQQAFARAYLALVRGAEPASVRGWLYTIAHNTAVNGLRDRQAESLDEVADLHAQRQPDDILAGREALRSVVRAVGGLPSRQRHVLVRQELDGRSHEQIASELGLTTGAVRQLAHRARASVRAAAAAVIPAPIWRLLPGQLGRSGGGELIAGSAFGAIVGKTAVALIAVAAAGGAVELTVARPASAPQAAAESAALRAPAPAATGTAPATGRHAPTAGVPGRGDAAGAGSQRRGTPSPGLRPAAEVGADAGGATPGGASTSAQRDDGGTQAPAAPQPAGAVAAPDDAGEVEGHTRGGAGRGGAGSPGGGATSVTVDDVPEAAEARPDADPAEPAAADAVEAPDPDDEGPSRVDHSSTARVEPAGPAPSRSGPSG